MIFSNFTFVDVETTGLDGKIDSIIEVGILRVENGKHIKSYRSTINPKMKISAEIQKITGISPLELMVSPTFESEAQRIAKLFPNSVVVAHNADFDYEFLETEFSRAGIGFSYPRLCTLKMSKDLYPYFLHYDLGTLLRKMKIPYGTRHRAYEDASYVWEVFKGFEKMMAPEAFQRYLMRMAQKPPKKKSLKESQTLMELF